MKWIRACLKRINFIPQRFDSQWATIVKWVLIGYLIRVTMMPLFASVDLLTNGWIGFILRERHQFVLSNDPPLIYYTLAFWYTILGPILPKNVFSEVYSNTAATPVSLSLNFRRSEPGIMIFSFASTIPYLIFDFALAFMFLRLLDDQNRAMFAFKLWMINPVCLYVSYFLGQYDIIAVFFLMLGLYFFKKKQMGWTTLSIGLAGAFKMFAFFFVPPIIYIHLKKHKGFTTKFKSFFLFLMISITPFILTQIASLKTPIYYESVNAATPFDFSFNGFFGKTMYYRGEPGQPFLSGLFFYFLDYSIGLQTLERFQDVIYLFPLVYGLFLLGLIYFKNWSYDRIWKAFLVFFLAYYATTLFNAQWFLWGQPLLILLITQDRGRFLNLYIILDALFFIYSMYWNATFFEVMSRIGVPGSQVLNIFRSILSAVCIFIIFLILKSNK